MASFDEIVNEEKEVLKPDFTRENGALLMKFPRVDERLVFNLSVTLKDFEKVMEVGESPADVLPIICIDFTDEVLDTIPAYQLNSMTNIYIDRFKALQGVDLGK